MGFAARAPAQPAKRCRGRAQRALDLSLRNFKYRQGKRPKKSPGEDCNPPEAVTQLSKVVK